MPQPGTSDSLKKDSVLLTGNYEHIFSGHSLQPVNKEPLPYKDPTPVWPAFVLLLPVALLIYLRVKYARKILPLIRGFFSLQSARQLEREDYRLTRGSSVILSFVYLTAFSFFLFQYNLHFQIVRTDLQPFVQFHFIFGGLLVIYLLKFMVNSILGIITGSPAQVYEYNFNIFLSNQGVGLFILPVAICMQYLQYPVFPMAVAGLGIFSVFYLIRLVKGLIIGLGSRSFSLFHIFLYLCGLEILPLIVLITFLVRLNTHLPD